MSRESNALSLSAEKRHPLVVYDLVICAAVEVAQYLSRLKLFPAIQSLSKS
jgi:hypothetical protein